jgi:hypothetical protein
MVGPEVYSRRIVAENFEEKEPLVIGTLNEAFVFMAGQAQNPSLFSITGRVACPVGLEKQADSRIDLQRTAVMPPLLRGAHIGWLQGMCGCRYDREPLRMFWMAVICFPGGDLVRAIQPMPKGLNMDFLRASSYTGAATTGQDAVVMGLVSKIPIEGSHILLVEDIIDTGKTLQVS